MAASSDEQNPETGYLEDCCWTDPQDQCPKRRMNPEPCQCRCHQDEKPSALTADEARELAWLRDERSKWHGAYMGAVRLAEESGKQRDAAEQRAQAAEAERDALKEEAADLLTFLEANERKPARNMRGTMTDFCVACGGAPTIHAMNPHTSTPDGHWIDVTNGGCIVWQLKTRLRALLRAAEGGERDA